jgi:methylated-DNA-protein-cysteine methyltransferase-like protein
MSGPLYQSIYKFVRQVPSGKVVTYGQVAQWVGGCTARMVGYAMAALHEEDQVPWQRVINAKGRISPHGFGFGSAMQQNLLEDEGIVFRPDGSVDLTTYGWIPNETGQLDG